MTVIPAAQLPEYMAHPDDLNLDDEPTLFEQVMSGNADTDSDTDDTSRDGDVATFDAKAEAGDSLDDADLTVAERRRRRARIQRKTQSKDHASAV